MPALPALLVFLLLGVSACGALPGGPRLSPSVEQAQAPALVPLEGLLALAEPGRATVDSRDALARRAAGLRARAVAMRGPVQDKATRERLAAALRAHPMAIR